MVECTGGMVDEVEVYVKSRIRIPAFITKDKARIEGNGRKNKLRVKELYHFFQPDGLEKGKGRRGKWLRLGRGGELLNGRGKSSVEIGILRFL